VLDVLAIALALVMAACNVMAIHTHHKLWWRKR
jgi:hypothetical protein